MIKAEEFIEILNKNNINFFTGVPDSKLQSFCDKLMEKYGISDNHIIAANEGNAVGLACGYNLATGCYPCVYLQNSGIGNIINPVASLLNENIYATAPSSKQISYEIKLDNELQAPIYENQKLGTITVKTPASEKTYNIYANENVKGINIFEKMLLKIYEKFQ